LQRLGQVLESGQVRPAKLATAARTEPAVARARLAALLSEAGMGELAAKVPKTDPRVSVRALDLSA
jgi:hypothetical protein